MECIAKKNSNPMFDEQLQGEAINEYSETVGKGHLQSPDASADRSDNMGSGRSAIVAPYEYMGGANSINDREQELERGQIISYIDFFKLESLRMKFVIVLLI